MADARRDTSGNETPDLGENIRRLRTERGWKLNRLAAETGLPQSTLSKVENGRMSLNYAKLDLVARTLDVDVGELFATATQVASRQKPMARRTLQKSNEGNTYKFEQIEYRYLCTELKNRLMVPALLKVHDRSQMNNTDGDYSVALTHLVGERFAYVLSGEVDFISEQYEPVRLKTGDSLYIDAAMPHAFIAPDGQTAEVIAIVSSDDHQYLRFVRHAANKGLADATTAYEEFTSGNVDQS